MTHKGHSRLTWLLSKALAKSFQRALSVVEILGRGVAHYPPIFIIGPPRSGSTLLVQAITEAFDIGYLSNFHCKWYGAPSLAESLFKPTANRPPECFASRHGVTQGSHAPSECGQYWYRFFRRKPAYVPLSDISPKNVKRFRRSVNALIAAFNKPVVFKNLYASLRIQPILHAFPKALFIIVRRNELNNAHSILKGRLDTYGTYDTWWSVEPPNIDLLRLLPAHQQTVEQIRSIHALIEKDLRHSRINPSQVISVDYEVFAADPNAMIDRLSGFFSANFVAVERVRSLPDSFAVCESMRIESSLYEQLSRYCGKGTEFGGMLAEQ